jgi:outer membrane protein assembly factor BamB
MTVPFFAARNGSWIRATPALSDGVLYVAGMRDVLVALDAETGKELWRVDFPKETGSPLPTFGFVSSPLVVQEAIFVQAGGALVKLDKKTGKRLWTVLEDGGGMMHSAFSSPVLTTLAGTPQLLVQTRSLLAGVDPDTGTVYWKRPIPAFRGMNILTPQPAFGGIFTSTYGGTTQWFPVAESAGKWSTGEGWSLRYEGYMTSPVLLGDHAYLLGKDQRAICVDLKRGKECWRTDRRFGQYWSLITDGEKLLALDQRGRLLLFRANPQEFEVLAERDLGSGETWAHLAVCGHEVFVRDLTGLTCYHWGKPSK